MNELNQRKHGHAYLFNKKAVQKRVLQTFRDFTHKNPESIAVEVQYLHQNYYRLVLSRNNQFTFVV